MSIGIAMLGTAPASALETGPGANQNPQAAPSAAPWGLQNLYSEKCLTAGVSREVVAISCNSSSSFQKWTGESGRAIIRSTATGLCLDSNAQGQAYLLECNGGKYQDWYEEAGGWHFVNGATGRCLAYMKVGNTVGTKPCSSATEFTWRYV